MVESHQGACGWAWVPIFVHPQVTSGINRTFGVCSAPLRLRSLHLLLGLEMCATDLVEVYREGRWCFYSPTEARAHFAAGSSAAGKAALQRCPSSRESRTNRAVASDRQSLPHRGE